jgi:hypothetical protein
MLWVSLVSNHKHTSSQLFPHTMQNLPSTTVAQQLGGNIEVNKAYIPSKEPIKASFSVTSAAYGSGTDLCFHTTLPSGFHLSRRMREASA